MSLYSLIYHEAYLTLEPYFSENRIEELNTSEDKDVLEALLSLTKFINSELESTALDKAATDRNEQRCSKTRKYKSKKKDENGNREVFTAKELKKGYSREKEHYSNESNSLDTRYSSLEDVLIRLQDRRITEDDNEILFSVLFKNRWNFRLQIALIAIALTLFVFAFVLAYLN